MHTPRPGGQGHMHARLSYKNFPSVHKPRPSLSALNCLFVHHLVSQPKSLGVIAWLLHCCSLAFCAQGMAGCKALPDWSHECPNFVPQKLCILAEQFAGCICVFKLPLIFDAPPVPTLVSLCYLVFAVVLQHLRHNTMFSRPCPSFP
jgi:hypothetical protein